MCNHFSFISVLGHSTAELVHAAKYKAYEEGKHACRHILNMILESPGFGDGLREKIEYNKKPVPLTEDEALAFFLDGRYSYRQYQQLRKTAGERNAQIYPAYPKILAARNRCVPPGIIVTEKKMEVNLQSLLCHVCKK